MGLLDNFDQGDSLQLGLLGLGGLGNVLASRQRRYSTNIADVSGPNTAATDWLPRAGLQLAQMRRDAEQRKRSDMLNQLTQSQLEEQKRRSTARIGLTSVLSDGIPQTDPRFRSAVAEYSPETALSMMNKDESPLVGKPGDVFLDRHTYAQKFAVPSKPEYKERDFPISADKIQKQYSMDGGQTWQSQGSSYDRRDPYLVFDQQATDGTTRRMAVPRPGGGAAPGSDAASGIPLGITKQPGAPEGVSAEAAGRLALVNEGTDAVKSVRDRIMPGGKIDREAITRAYLGVPGEGAQLKNLLRNAIGNRIRIESGANITEVELDRQSQRYMPGPLDSEATVKQKLDGLDQFFSDFRKVSKGSEKLDKAPRSGLSRASDGVLDWHP